VLKRVQDDNGISPLYFALAMLHLPCFKFAFYSPMQPPKYIEQMQVLHYAPTAEYADHLKKYMPLVPALFVIIKDEDESFCLLGTDANFDNWDRYTNYVFKELAPAMDLPHVIFRLPPIQWKKV
jgi:hypothetical protein